MAKENLFVRHSFLTAIKELSMAERGRLFTAMLEYSIEGNTPVLGGAEKIIWPIAKDMIDEDNVKYQERCDKSKAAADMRWHTDAYERIPNDAQTCQMMPTPTPTPKVKEKLSVNTLSKEKSAAFKPPTLEEVAEYCQKRGNNVDPKTFYDYFTEGKWHDSHGQPVKNWKQKIITWEKKEKQGYGKSSGNYKRDRKDTPHKDWGI